MFTPIEKLAVPLDIYGVRYPEEARAELAQRGARYHGWAANAPGTGNLLHATSSRCTCPAASM